MTTETKSPASGVLTGLWSRTVKGREHRYTDAAALLVLLILTTVAAWDLLVGGAVVGMDAVTQFYPWYSYLGESLRSGEIPGWNPHQFSGTPFAADPLSGWTYLPAMVLFTLLPVATAAKGYMFMHLLLAGFFAYALARSLEMNAAGALLAAVAYEFTGFLYVQNTCCFAYASVMVWLPLAFLGAEMAIRSTRRLDRGLWWGAAGLGLSQILASWLGQGSYYALLALGGYVAYRTLLFPPEGMRSLRARLSGLVLHGGAVLLFGFGLAAAGILPRLEYNALSNLAGGYPGSGTGAPAEPAGGWSMRDWDLLLEHGPWYAGGAVLVLALAAPLVARRRFAAPYFAALSFCALILTVQGPTPLHSALYLLPSFEQLHPHIPQRVMVVFFLGIALLAGATLSRLGELDKKARFLLVLPVLAVILPITAFASIPRALLLALIFSGVLLATHVRLPTRLAAWRRLAPTLLVLVVFADLLVSGRAALAEHGNAKGYNGVANNIQDMDLAAYYHPSEAARFLQSRGEEETFRYLGYGPRYGVRRALSSPYRFTDPRVRVLEVNNRAISLGLQSTQGYNAVQLARYGEYLGVLNGRGQGYHYADVFEGGLDSPLLDLLNVRYIVAPAEVDLPEEGEEEVGVRRLALQHPTVYEDDQVKVLENREALPRAWIVHRARRVEPEEALALLSSGAVDPEETALLEGDPPDLGFPGDTSADRASVEEYEADRMEIRTSTKAPGLLVLSEAYYPAWKAYVDGEPVPIHRADHLLRAVPVPEGEHTVELRYESWTLRVGMIISSSVLAALAVLVIARIRRQQNGTGDPLPARPWRGISR